MNPEINQQIEPKKKISTQKLIFIIIIILDILAVVGLVIYFIFFNKEEKEEPKELPKECTIQTAIPVGTRSYRIGNYVYTLLNGKTDFNDEYHQYYRVKSASDLTGKVIFGKQCEIIDEIPVEKYDLNNLFSGKFTKLSEIDIREFDSSKMTSMQDMFALSTYKVDISKLDTSNVTNMYGMFSISEIYDLDFSNFNTSKVTNMNFMFRDLKTNKLDLKSFDTSNVTSMYSMFSGVKLDKLDLRNFDTSKVTTMHGMFIDTEIKTIDLSSFTFDSLDEDGTTLIFEGIKEGTIIYLKNQEALEQIKAHDKSFDNKPRMDKKIGKEVDTEYYYSIIDFKFKE